MFKKFTTEAQRVASKVNEAVDKGTKALDKTVKNSTQGDDIYTAIKDTDFPKLAHRLAHLDLNTIILNNPSGQESPPLGFAISKLINEVNDVINHNKSITDYNVYRKIAVLLLISDHCKGQQGEAAFKDQFNHSLIQEIGKKGHIASGEYILKFVESVVNENAHSNQQWVINLQGFRINSDGKCSVSPEHKATFTLIADTKEGGLCSVTQIDTTVNIPPVDPLSHLDKEFATTQSTAIQTDTTTQATEEESSTTARIDTTPFQEDPATTYIGLVPD